MKKSNLGQAERKGSSPMYKVKEEKDVHIKMRDGIRLAADIRRPDAQGKFPALLAMCPYSKEVQSLPLPPQHRGSPLWFGSLEAGDSEYFVSRGYVHVIADIRGTGYSEGEYWNMFSRKEQEDGYDLVEWLAQQDWCDGNVGMVGISYFAIIQYLVAAQQPPHLKAIFPLDGWGDLYRDIAYHGGMLNAAFFRYLWSSEIAATGNVSAMEKTISSEQLKGLIEEAKSNEDLRINPFLYVILANPQMNPMLFDLMLNPNDGPFYWERSAYTKYDKIKIPVYLGSRWDGFFLHLPGALKGYMGIDTPKKLIITPRSYERPWHEYHELVVKWYDYWLKGIDTGIMDEPPIKMFVRGANQWRFENEWPLARTEWTKLYLRSHKRLLREPESYSHEPDCFVHQSPVITFDIHPLEYLSPPMPQDMELTGPIALYLYASIDTPDTNWIVTLSDVDMRGLATKLTGGWLKASHRILDEDKSKPWQPCHTFMAPQPVVPGQIHEYAIEITPTSNVFKAGHRLKLEIKSSDFSMENPRFYHLPSSKATLHKIYHDKEHPSHLLVPVIPQNP
ncbi:CocE/NonD family hydrolase [Thermodesulfobacteriota bacterium]